MLNNAFRRLITVPHSTIAMTNGQEIRHIFPKHDLDHGCRVTRWQKWGTWNVQQSRHCHKHQRTHRHRRRDLTREYHASRWYTVFSFSASLVTGTSNHRCPALLKKRWSRLDFSLKERYTFPPWRNWTHLRASGLTISNNSDNSSDASVFRREVQHQALRVGIR